MMKLKVNTFKFVTVGGGVEIEDAGGDSVTIVESRSDVGPATLRRRAAKRLRAMADQLDQEADRGGWSR